MRALSTVSLSLWGRYLNESAYRRVDERIFGIRNKKGAAMKNDNCRERKACGLYLRVSTERQANIKVHWTLSSAHSPNIPRLRPVTVMKSGMWLKFIGKKENPGEILIDQNINACSKI